MKRAFDLTLALILSLPALLICLLAAPVVWRDTRANPFFVQTRVGRNGEHFRMVKLRTMRADTPDAASHETPVSQITRVGAVLRKFKVDELPQLWNVLRGEMSFVGPRPCLPAQKELIAERAQRGVDALRPGITGPSQVEGIDMSQPERLAQSDARYLGEWSLARDLGLVVGTITGRGRGDAVQGRQ